MIWFSVALIGGLGALIWSADRFVTGAAGTASVLGLSPLLIGMLVVGFGTSAPEMLISAISAAQGASGIALGNAWGSNIANIALILGVSALVRPLAVRSRILKIELPVLAGVTGIAAAQILNGVIDRLDALVLLVGIAALVGWSIYQSRSAAVDTLAEEMRADPHAAGSPQNGSTLTTHVVWLVVGLIVLVASSRVLVWGAVGLASAAGISDLVIGLTIVAVGTSLPEMASSVAAARRGEDDIAVGNVIGSNLFNTLGVVGIGAMIRPIVVDPAVLTRDLPVMAGLTLLLFVVGIGWRGRPGRINRWEGALLLAIYLGYMATIAATQMS
ncbi:MAG TPA: calcium/sodium antiporter [Alkalispirochaeta sp.]|nr:calcium/sodium antiporter [Alkalispirochaeta sp.]